MPFWWGGNKVFTIAGKTGNRSPIERPSIMRAHKMPVELAPITGISAAGTARHRKPEITETKTPKRSQT